MVARKLNGLEQVRRDLLNSSEADTRYISIPIIFENSSSKSSLRHKLNLKSLALGERITEPLLSITSLAEHIIIEWGLSIVSNICLYVDKASGCMVSSEESIIIYGFEARLAA